MAASGRNDEQRDEHAGTGKVATLNRVLYGEIGKARGSEIANGGEAGHQHALGVDGSNQGKVGSGGRGTVDGAFTAVLVRDVGVTVYEARQHSLGAEIDHLRICGNGEAGAYLDDAPVLHQDDSVL